MAMNYDNDMNPRARRKLPRMNPPSMRSGSDVMRGLAGRGRKLGPVVERPMLSAGAMPMAYGAMGIDPSAALPLPNMSTGRRRRRGVQVSNRAPETQFSPQYGRRANEFMAALSLMSGQGNF